MSDQRRDDPPVQVRERAACMCVHGSPCSTFAPGHALHLIQARLAAATPSDWVDGVVDRVDSATGEIVVRALEAGATIALWSGAGATDEVESGHPVAVHTRYQVLAAGRRRFNVAVL